MFSFYFWFLLHTRSDGSTIEVVKHLHVIFHHFDVYWRFYCHRLSSDQLLIELWDESIVEWFLNDSGIAKWRDTVLSSDFSVEIHNIWYHVLSFYHQQNGVNHRASNFHNNKRTGGLYLYECCHFFIVISLMILCLNFHDFWRCSNAQQHVSTDT